MNYSTRSRNRGTPRSMIAALALLFASSLFLAACGGDLGGSSGGSGDSSPETTSVVVTAGGGGGTNALTNFSFADVATVDVRVVLAGGNPDNAPEVVGSTTLTSPTFSEKISGLSTGQALDFHGDAEDSGAVLLYTTRAAAQAGAAPTTETLPAPGAINISMKAVDDGVAYTIPAITGVSLDESSASGGSVDGIITIGETVAIDLEVAGEGTETLTVDFDSSATAAAGTAEFISPSNNPSPLALTAGVATGNYPYVAPSIAAANQHIVKVSDADGNSSQAAITINVGASGGAFGVNFGPAIVPGTLAVIRVDVDSATFGVTVDDESPGSLLYAWSWGGRGTLTNADANPATITGLSGAVTAATWAASLATLTVTGHPFVNGDAIRVLGMDPSGYNGDYTVAGATANTFDVTIAVNPGAFVAAGTAFLNSNTGTLALIVTDAGFDGIKEGGAGDAAGIDGLITNATFSPDPYALPGYFGL